MSNEYLPTGAADQNYSLSTHKVFERVLQVKDVILDKMRSDGPAYRVMVVLLVLLFGAFEHAFKGVTLSLLLIPCLKV